MTPDHRRDTATILEFPTRRLPKPGLGRPDGGLTAATIAAQPLALTGAWYHEAALKESEPTRRN